jgi:hypothetical protein
VAEEVVDTDMADGPVEEDDDELDEFERLVWDHGYL